MKALLAWLVLASFASVAPTAQADPLPQWSEYLYPQNAGHRLFFDPGTHALVLTTETNNGPGLHEVWTMPLDTASTWQRTVTSGPQPFSQRPTLAFDALGRRLFAFVDTNLWVLQLDSPGAWSILTVAGTPPQPRQAGAFVYDPVRNRLVLFGGSGTVAGQPRSLADLYQIDLSGTPTWSVLSSAGAPPGARSGASIVFDSARDRAVLFGGTLEAFGNDIPDSTLWALSLGDSAKWSLLSGTGSAPSPRALAAMAYDPLRDRFFVGSGLTGLIAGAKPKGDLFFYDVAGAAWHAVPTSPEAPPAAFAFAYDSAHDLFWAHGGVPIVNQPGDGTHTLDAATLAWSTPPSPRNPPPAAVARAMAYDAAGDRFLWFGLESASPGMVWQLGLPRGVPTWRRILPGGTAPPTAGAAAYDSRRGRVLLYPDGATTTVYALSLGANPAWSAIAAAGPSPGPRTRHQAVYDAGSDRFLVYGGTTNVGGDGGGRNDAWVLSLGASPTWSLLLPGGTPPPAYWISSSGDMSVVYDPIAGRMLLRQRTYVPLGSSAYARGENYELRGLDVPPLTWGALSSADVETIADHSGFDPWRGRMLVPGRESETENGEFVHALPPGANLVAADTPGWLRQGAGVFDPVHDQLIVYGARTIDPSDDLAILSFGGAAGTLTIESCPAETSLAAGSILDLQAALQGVAPTPQDVQYTLTGQRAWPGLPLVGTTRVTGGETDTLQMELAVPDSAAIGAQTFRLRVSFVAAGAIRDSCDFVLRSNTLVGVDTLNTFGLAAVAPMPAFGQIRIVFTLTHPGPAHLVIYDSSGRHVRTLADGPGVAGRNEATWQGEDDRGVRRGPGVYLLRLDCAEGRRTARVVWLGGSAQGR